MMIGRNNYRLTKHGRAMFLMRVDPYATDREILQRCVDGIGVKCVWKPEYNRAYSFVAGQYTPIVAWRLVTVWSWRV